MYDPVEIVSLQGKRIITLRQPIGAGDAAQAGAGGAAPEARGLSVL